LAKVHQRLPDGVEIEIWWQDEARIGQKNKLTRRWARRGTRPRAAHDQRTKWAYIFGAICPAKGKGAGLVMPYCNSHAMSAHLAEVSPAVDANAPAGEQYYALVAASQDERSRPVYAAVDVPACPPGR